MGGQFFIIPGTLLRFSSQDENKASFLIAQSRSFVPVFQICLFYVIVVKLLLGMVMTAGGPGTGAVIIPWRPEIIIWDKYI